jgi:hypothetical protein
MRNIAQWRAALCVAGALMFGVTTPGQAASLPGAVATLGKAAPNQVIDVQARYHGGGGGGSGWHGGHGGWHHGGGYYHGGWGWGWGAPVAAGIVAGSIVAGAYPYYYGNPYYYGPPVPAYVEPAPVYVDPGYVRNGPVRQCWVATDRDRSYGYWRPC